MLEFIQGLPSPVWTLLGGVVGGILGVGGTLLANSINRKAADKKDEREYLRSRQNALEARMREAYVDVLTQARALHEGTSRQRAALRNAPQSTEGLEAASDLVQRLNTLDASILRASIESMKGMRERLECVRMAAEADNLAQVPGRSTDADRAKASAEFKKAIDDMNTYIHFLFEPEFIYGTPQPSNPQEVGSQA